ncbi:MAG: hypothetical protein IPO99_08205 [Nitrospira sp.]|nr:hypothetical protein [Nitrospira sp.]
MVLNLLKAHPREQIQSILAKSFAQFQLNQRTAVLETKLDGLRVEMEPFGPRVCSDWITQWQVFDQARNEETAWPVGQAGIARCRRAPAFSHAGTRRG